jgi:hypothetical protein
MANCQIVARTNYVAIREDKRNDFTTYCKLFEMEVVEKDGKYALLASEGNDLASQISESEMFLEEQEIAERYPSVNLYREWLIQLEVADANGEVREDELDDLPGAFFDLHTVAEMMEEGQVIVAQTVGHEKLRYVFGYAEAINHKGERFEVSLNDVIEHAMKHFGATEADLQPAY